MHGQPAASAGAGRDFQRASSAPTNILTKRPRGAGRRMRANRKIRAWPAVLYSLCPKRCACGHAAIRLCCRRRRKWPPNGLDANELTMTRWAPLASRHLHRAQGRGAVPAHRRGKELEERGWKKKTRAAAAAAAACASPVAERGRAHRSCRLEITFDDFSKRVRTACGQGAYL